MANTNQAPSGVPPTTVAYKELQLGYDFFNRELFDGKLPPCLITFQRKGSRTLAYYSPKRFATTTGNTADEIALNPRHFKNSSFITVMATLVHEMVHLWQQHFGRPSRSCYHNKEWGAKALWLGLHPSHTGRPGGRMTGQQMDHYVVPGGRFEIAANKLRAMLPALTWFDVDAAERLPKGLADADLVPTPRRSGRRTVYRCPKCQMRGESGNSAFFVICGYCDVALKPTGFR